jgi:NADPH2:quinone reductase
MKAIVCAEFGPPESLILRTLADPIPAPDELLVRVGASSINFPDALMIEGRYQVKPQLPFVPGAEAAGVVIGKGDEVTGFALGDRVAVLTRVGACRHIGNERDPLAG